MLHKIRDIIGITLATIVVGSFIYSLEPTQNLTKHVENPAITAPNYSMGIDKKEIDIYNFLNKYQSIIRLNAAREGIPDTYLASVIASENYGRKIIDSDLKDFIGCILNLDVSLGPGQVRKSTAAWLDGITGDLTPEQQEEYERRLKDPETNIEYVARNLAYLKKQGK